jgi:hypothetical protein
LVIVDTIFAEILTSEYNSVLQITISSKKLASKITRWKL